MSAKLQLQNKIINGSFDFWQRGTSFAAIANNVYNADRFHYIKTGAMIQTIARSTDVPSSSSSIYSLLATVTTIDASIAVGDYTGIIQHIEGNVLRSFKSKKMVMTFWVKAFKAGTYCISIRNGTATRSLVLEYTVNASNTWEKKTVRFTHDTSGTWSYNNGIGLTVVFVQASGSTFQTTAGIWQNGQYLATANQVNGVDNVANNFQLADVCLVEDNEGQTRVPDFMYAGRDYFEELQLCQRYYVKTWGLNVPKASMNSSDGFRHRSQGVLSGNVFGTWSLPTPMRIIPAPKSYSPVTQAAGQIRDQSGGIDIGSLFVQVSEFVIVITNNGSVVSGNYYQWHMDADAEL